MDSLNRCLTIDPGWNTGIAYWVGDLDPITQVIKEPARRKKIKIEPERLDYMFRKFDSIVRIYKDEIDRCYIEGVELWAYNLRSMTSAKRGDLFALAYMVGGYTAMCQRNGIEVMLLYPTGEKKKERVAWKGQLDARKLAARIVRINNKTYPEHVREAVGMGFSILGIL